MASTLTYVVADVEQASEDLAYEWARDARLRWVIDTAEIANQAAMGTRTPQRTRDTLIRSRLVAERDAILTVMPPDPTPHIRAAERQRARIARDREKLATASGRYRDEPIADALRELDSTRNNVERLQRNLAERHGSRHDRRGWRRDLAEWQPKLEAASRSVADLSAQELDRLEREEHGLADRLSDLWDQRDTYDHWVARHPEATTRLARLDEAISHLDSAVATDLARDPARPLGRERGIDRTPDLALGL